MFYKNIPNPVSINKDISTIYIVDNFQEVCECYIDTKNLEEINNRKNSIRGKTRYFNGARQTYAVIYCKEVNREVLLHKLIMKPPDGKIIDHFDRNGLNNLESNLNIVTQSQNMLNKGLQKNNRIGHKSIRKEGKYFCINLSKKYETLDEAIRIRDKIYKVIYENDYPEMLSIINN